jgi:hypothetical protein
MTELTFQLPDAERLAAAVLPMVSARLGDGAPALRERTPSEFMTSFPSEIATCELADGRRVRLLCKYGKTEAQHSHGHRGGVVYEAEVYRRVLRPLGASTPRFYGSHRDRDEFTWLILEYLDRSHRVNKAPDEAIVLAAAWIGGFHAACEPRIDDVELSFLRRYDADYYQGWARRTLEFCAPSLERRPWLPVLCERFGAVVEELLRPPLTVVHGEYYPKNILFQDHAVYPIDWESAAIGRGEIDLASLIEGWPQDIATRCVEEYERARWPQGTPDGFERRFDAARAYMILRWLGDRPYWTQLESAEHDFEQLRRTAERLELV